MALNIELMSKEMIKPSTPTPHHLRDYKLSLLDRIAPPIYSKIILFYEADEGCDHAERCLSLKKALAKTLNLFYPLAGRAKEDFVVQCNDDGAEFFEARVPCKLWEIVENPDINNLNQLFPYYIHYEFQKEVLLAVQYNIFDCEGSAVGICISHKLADGSSLAMFANALAAIARGGAEVITPSFDAATHFPPKDLSGFAPSIGIVEDEIVTRRFIFNKSSIDALKELASSGTDSQVKQSTRVEAVSAFIWKRIMAISEVKPGPRKMFAAVHAVNLRPKMLPPISNSFGNLFQPAFAPLKAEDDDYHTLVSVIRSAVREINHENVKKLQSGDWYINMLKKESQNFSKGNIEFVNFTSWCGFPLYEVDFGWGKPIWVSSPSRPYKNMVAMMSTRSGDGIEAWANLLKDDMAIFERDPELLSFASSNN